MKFWLLLHVLVVVVGFGIAFAQPMVQRLTEGSDEAFARLALWMQTPALVLVLLSGFALAATKDVSMRAPWISAAFAVVLVAIGVQVALADSHRKGRETAVRALTGITHLLLVVGLVLMVWQPGGSG